MRQLREGCDAALVVGTRFVAGLTGATPAREMQDKPIVQLDVDPEEVGRNFNPAVGIVSDAKLGLAALAERVARYNSPRPSRRDELTALKDSVMAEQGRQDATPARLRHGDQAELPEDGVFFRSAGGLLEQHLLPLLPAAGILHLRLSGTLGYGLRRSSRGAGWRVDRRVVSIR